MIFNTIVAGGGDDVSGKIVDGTITEYINSDVTTVRSSAFYGCTQLQFVEIPNATRIGYAAFRSCTALTTVIAPNVSTMSSAAFQQCSMLTSIDMPLLRLLPVYAFSQCTALQMASFSALSSIAACFQQCVNLISLYLLGSSVTRMTNSTTFTSTPIAGYSTVAGRYGSIFVPSSLLSSYISAASWSYFSSRFVGV